MKIRFILLFVGFVLLDQIIKFFIVDRIRHGYEGDSFFHLTFYKNTGIAFGIPFNGWLILIASFLIVGYLFWHYRSRLTEDYVLFGLIMVVSGAFGNAIDRIFRGYVVDYVAISVFPVFNLADVLIVVGVGFLLIQELLIAKK